MAFFPDCLKVKLSSSLPDFVTSYDQSEGDSEGLFSLTRPPSPTPTPRGNNFERLLPSVCGLYFTT